VLEESQETGNEIEIEKYVQSHPAQKHDLFLIPNSTVHSAGAGNMVLEISATPYIFTFKMYDWVRLDLEGNPRPINIDHAFNNLDFNRKGKQVYRELISKPQVIEQARRLPACTRANPCRAFL
jgi:mannose-6-phosphate isomerase class I